MRSKEGDDTESLSLPVDLIIEILTKLPPRSLSRLICVSKLWLSIIHGKYFNDLYLTRSSTRPRLLLHRYCHDTRRSHYSSLSSEPSLGDSITLPGCQISPPVRGLICCVDHDSSIVVIGNPSTGQFLTLTDAITDIIFFGYDPVNDLYKVLSMYFVHDIDGSVVLEKSQVLTLGGAQESWRVIECKYPYYPGTQGICHNGVVYYGAWSNLTDRRSVVVGFDLRSEEFSLITLPEDVKIVSRFESDLVRYNGKIALVNVSLTRKFDLWVLMDVKKHEWSKYSVVAPTCDFFRCRGTIETGELIFEQFYFGDQFSILYYDPKQDKARRVDLERRGDTTSGGRKLFVDHVESPMFLPRKFIH
ncbi:F-box/kelch-repeat protein At3g04660-like [Brassica rapa]|uniref:F-box/kelch-repeat protein At3g04660-like n=1 Tax=Brassica campestris TaxID=3711 RepID=UPI00142DB053|nr:F-box/kelch-repeat protein At3g04660-like [Brassica rapa]